MRLMRPALLYCLCCLTSCETSDKALNTAERLLTSGTGRTITDIARGKDPKQILKEKTDIYQRNPEAAVRKAKGQDFIPSRDFLFEPANNVELGAAYLNVLSSAQLERIENPVSREYCVISAYNTGPRNVFKAFSTDSATAVTQINTLKPPAVYERLKGHLPYQETKDYLTKVVTFRKQFISSADR